MEVGRQIRKKWRRKESENDIVVYPMKGHEIHIERVRREQKGSSSREKQRDRHEYKK